MNKSFIHMRVIFICFALFLFASSAFSEFRFAALINDTSSPYWKSFEQGLLAGQKENNIQLHIYTLQRATDAEEQLNQCERSLLESPQVILFAAVNGLNLASCLQKAERAGAVLVDVDGNVDEGLAKKMGVRVAFSVASDNFELGAKAARYLVKYHKELKNAEDKKQFGKVFILEGIPGSMPNEKRREGFLSALPPSFSVVARQSAHWDRFQALNITSQILLQHKKLDVIFAANDPMALGALEALQIAKRSGVVVIGIDGNPDAIQSIESGKLTASVAQLPFLMAGEAIRKSITFLTDKTPLEFNQRVPIVVLDKTVLQSKTEPLLTHLSR